MKKLLLLALLLTAPLTLFAQLEPDAATKAACAAATARPFDGGLDPRVEPDCDSSAYYFGIGRPNDFVLARSCAFIERYHAKTAKDAGSDSNIFAGPGILSMVYANGEGTPRDLALAREFTCENKNAAPAELAARLKLLDKIAANPLQPPHFSLCETSKSGLSDGWCASIQVRLNDARRVQEMEPIYDALTPQGQEAFKKLQTAEGEFEQLRTDKEVDQTGTARAAFSLREEDRLHAQFLSDLKAFAKPGYTQPVRLAEVNARMNMDLAKLQADAARQFVNTTITWAGVQATQNSWLKLREAWQAYGAVVYPTVPGDTIATQLTRERLYHLHKLLTMQ